MKKWAWTVIPVLLGVSGCYSTYNVPVDAVYKLNGYRAGENRAMQDTAGHIHEFNQRKALTFQFADGSRVEDKFSAIDVSDSMFTGQSKAGLVKIDLSQVRTAKVREHSVSKTLGLSLGIGIPLLIIGGGFASIGIIALSFRH